MLQVSEVYLNVSRGQAASDADLEKAFPGKTRKQVVEHILEKGDFQVGEKERGAELDRIKNEVIDIVASRLVDPKSKRVYTTGMIEKALDQLSTQSRNAGTEKQDGEGAQSGEQNGKAKEVPKWSGVATGKPAKAQALNAVKALVAHQPIPVARVQMKLRITCPTSVLKQAVKSVPKAHPSKEADRGEEKAHGTVKDAILSLIDKIESQDVMGSEWEAVGLVEPGDFKTLNSLIESHTKGRGNVQVLDMAVGVDV